MKITGALEKLFFSGVLFAFSAGCVEGGTRIGNDSAVSGHQGVLRGEERLVHFTDSVYFSPVRTGVIGFSFLDFADPFFSAQWYLSNKGQKFPSVLEGKPGADIGLPSIFPHESNDREVILALIDSGVDFEHPDFDSSRFFVNRGETGIDSAGRDKAHNGLDDDGNGYVDDARGWSFADDSPNQIDALGHGTHLAGLLLAKADNGIGIASPWSGFRVMSLQIFSGARPSVSAEKIAQAIRYAVDNGASVVSASFGTQSYSEEIFQAINHARQKDVLVVSAAGNFRRNIDNEPSYPASYRLDNQITVGASDNRDIATNFTNYGNTVDIFAPGEAIQSTAPGGQYAIRSGTSQACPLVAAVAAQLKAQSPDSTSQQIKARILDGADESLGLTVFSDSDKRLSFKNALKALTGERIEYPKGRRQELLMVLQSEHPYRSQFNESHEIVLPEGANGYRLHFDQFSTQSTDVLVIFDDDGKPVQRFSGQLGAFWSGFVSARKIHIAFSTDKFVADWGWRIDKIEVDGM
ncbi:MAG: S8 family peptidase [Silvanigrellaceae bacterium]